jgi:hypothetical protein
MPEKGLKTPVFGLKWGFLGCFCPILEGKTGAQKHV